MSAPHVVNLGLIGNPMNWLTIILMVTIAGFLVDSFVLWNRQLAGRSH